MFATQSSKKPASSKSSIWLASASKPLGPAMGGVTGSSGSNVRRGGVPGIGSFSTCRAVRDEPRSRLANCSAVNRRPVVPKAVGCGLLCSAGGVFRNPDAGGVMRPESELFCGAGARFVREGV